MPEPFTSFNIFENFEFLKFRCHATASLATYNFFVSQRPSYFQKINFKDIVPEWLQNFSEIHLFQQRKSGPKVAKVRIAKAHSGEQLPLLMQFLYGVTTLRNTWIWTAAPRGNEIRAHEENS